MKLIKMLQQSAAMKRILKNIPQTPIQEKVDLYRFVVGSVTYMISSQLICSVMGLLM